MTMDYHNRYNACQDYYCPPYQGAGYPYQQHQQQMNHIPHQQMHLHQHSMPGAPIRNYNNNMVGPTSAHHQVPSQPQPPYFTSFQQHNHHQQRSEYSIPYVPNFLVSSGSGLTPTLTPTTLATLEQSFIELQSGQQNGVRDPITQSGFVPPVVDPGHSADVSLDSQEDYSSEYSDSEWEPQAKRGRMLSDMGDIKNVNLIVTSNGTINAAPQRKYTRRNKDEKLPPEEEERRRVRRERNKVAAAKCRQRRVDHTNELVEETDKLEAEQNQLESEIQSLQQEKDQLEFILQAHQPLCKVDPSRPHSSSKVKLEPVAHSSSLSAYSHNSRDPCPAPENLSMSAVSSNAASRSTTSSHGALEASSFSSRPNSLPLIKRDRSQMLSLTSATGVTINTPTSGVSITPSSLFCPGLDSMVDGSTGLTPLTGMSCSSQVQRNSSDSGSEAVGSPTLISL